MRDVTNKKLRCLIGLHKYEQDREISIGDVFPYPGVPYTNPERECVFCGKRQYWLPGFGGSELGSWQDK